MFIALISGITRSVGAACNSNSTEHMALRWSAELVGFLGYKHRAPLEHFLRRHQAKLFGAKPP